MTARYMRSDDRLVSLGAQGKPVHQAQHCRTTDCAGCGFTCAVHSAALVGSAGAGVCSPPSPKRVHHPAAAGLATVNVVRMKNEINARYLVMEPPLFAANTLRRCRRQRPHHFKHFKPKTLSQAWSCYTRATSLSSVVAPFSEFLALAPRLSEATSTVASTVDPPSPDRYTPTP